MKAKRVAPRAAALLGTASLMVTLAPCGSDASSDAGPTRTRAPNQSQTAPMPSRTSGDSATAIDRPITEKDVLGVWNNHRDTATAPTR